MSTARVTSAGLDEWYEALESWSRAWTSLLPVWPWVAPVASLAAAPAAEPAAPFRAHPPGRSLAELSVGDSASVTKRISQADIDAFARISGDDNPAHVDAGWAAGSRLGGRVAHGMLTAGLISAVLGTKLPGPGSIYMSQTLRWVAPVRPGDLLTATATITEIVAEKGRVVLETVVTRDGEPVLTGEALVMPPAGRASRRRRRRPPARGRAQAARQAPGPTPGGPEAPGQARAAAPAEGGRVIARIAVVGAGVMGSEIAQATAAGGVEVVMLDADPAALERGVAHVARIGERRVARGPHDRGRGAGRSSPGSPRRADAGALAACDLAIEAVPEVMEIKREVFRRLDAALPPGALLASNTSGLSITELGRETGRPDRVLGPPLLQPRERDAAGGSGAGRRHRRARPWPRARSSRGRSARRRCGCASAPGSWSTACSAARWPRPTAARRRSAPSGRRPTGPSSTRAPPRWAPSPSAT